MSIEEYREGTGVYTVPASQISDNVLFIRDPKKHTDEEIAPLLHICHKEIDPERELPTYVLETEVVRWDFYHGFYYCQGCNETWDRDDRDGLMAIWSDGYGTGDEGLA